MKLTLEQALGVIAELIAAHKVDPRVKPLRQTKDQRMRAWIKASELLERAAAPETDFEKTRREILAMPSVQHVAAAAVAVHARLNELGGIRQLKTLTLAEVEEIAHVALFTKDPGSSFAKDNR